MLFDLIEILFTIIVAFSPVAFLEYVRLYWKYLFAERFNFIVPEDVAFSINLNIGFLIPLIETLFIITVAFSPVAFLE